MSGNIKNVMAAIDYIESHLHENPDLETIAEALHYSKYHLHRMFTDTVEMTIQTYAQRRRLTEAAKLLVFSDKSILEIALGAGYDHYLYTVSVDYPLHRVFYGDSTCYQL